MMLSNWQFKICKCYVSVPNPQAIFMPTVSHKQAKDSKVLASTACGSFLIYIALFIYNLLKKFHWQWH